MSLTLKPEVEGLVREVVASGGYRDASDAVGEAMELLRRRDQEKLDALNQAVDEGEADIREGRVIEVRTKKELDHFFASL